jgi:hypothetical protein
VLKRLKGKLQLPVVALFFVGGALLCGLLTLCSSIRAANRVARLTPATLAELAAGEPGREVLIEGKISGENPIRSTAYGFVAYLRKEREIEDDEGTPSPGSWSVRERVTPPLLLDLSGSLVQIENDDYELADGEIIEEDPGLDRYSDTLYEGLKIGTPVITVGAVVPSREVPHIKADFVARGTRASYVTEQRSAGILFCVGSLLVAVLGGLVLLWDRVRWLFPRRR